MKSFPWFVVKCFYDRLWGNAECGPTGTDNTNCTVPGCLLPVMLDMF